VSLVELILIGGGEHGRVVAEAARSDGRYALKGFLDPLPCADTVERLGVPRLGGDEALAGWRGMWAVLGVGGVGLPVARRRLVQQVAGSIAGWAAVVHASAWVSPTAVIGEGAVIMAVAAVNTGARIGAHCVVNTGAVIEHDVVLGDFAQVAPGAVVGGGTVIGDDAFIGLGASVRDHIRIGKGAFVGMGAVVVADVPEGAVVRGIPARGVLGEWS